METSQLKGKQNIPFGAIKDFQSQMMSANASPAKLQNKLTIIEVE
jgi:hypothetical protein